MRESLKNFLNDMYDVLIMLLFAAMVFGMGFGIIFMITKAVKFAWFL